MKRLLALLVVAGIPATLMIWMRTHQSSGFATTELIVYPLLFGGLGIVITLALKRYFLGEPLSDLNSGDGSWRSDLLWGGVLTLVYFGLFFLARMTLMGVLEFRPNRELLGLMLDMRESPLLMLIWFGPVLWIGISLYEEVIRTFMLTTLWTYSSSRLWIVTAILLTAALVGLAHWSQGPYGIVTIGIKGAVIGAFYYYRRRLLPLVIAHVLYDGLQVGMLLLTYPR